MSDFINREDAIEVGNKIVEELALSSIEWDDLKCWAKELFDALPSADRQTDESCQDCPLYDSENHNCPRFNKVIPQTRTEMKADAVQGANLINRHDATTVISEECWKCNRTINDDLFMRIMPLPTSQQTDCTDFIMWLIEIVLDEEDWELNAVCYGEIIARKLKKLGLLEVKDGYYIRSSAEPSKSTDQNVADVPSGDLISRADAVKAMRKLLGDDFGKRAEIELNCLTGYVPSAEKKEGEYADEIARRIATIIENEQDMRVILESADRPKGEWVEDLNFVHRAWRCSECFAVTSTKTPFCHECGADMKGKKR